MSAAARRTHALLLAALAAFGLVLAPLAHAELHAREAQGAAAAPDPPGAEAAVESPPDLLALLDAQSARDAEDRDVALVYGPGTLYELRRARAAETAPHQHGGATHRHQPGHSHGQGPHGAGTLSHLALALHAAPPPPQAPRLAPPHAAPALPRAPLASLRLLASPENAQAPPRC